MINWMLVLILVTPGGTAMTHHYGLSEEGCRKLAAGYEQQMSDYSKHAGARALCLPTR